MAGVNSRLDRSPACSGLDPCRRRVDVSRAAVRGGRRPPDQPRSRPRVRALRAGHELLEPGRANPVTALGRVLLERPDLAENLPAMEGNRGVIGQRDPGEESAHAAADRSSS